MFISNLTPKQKKEIGELTVDAALDRWQKLYAIGRKPNTLDYHVEILRVIRATWPDLQTVVADVTDAQCVTFAERIAHFSTPRFNGMVNTMRNVIPEMACIPRRRQIIVPKAVPTLEEFERLLAALDVAVRGHSGLLVRFLAFTGLRINEARLLKWSNIREDHIAVPAEITKNGKPRCIPFILGVEKVLSRLRLVRRYHVKRNGFLLPQADCKTALKFACRLAEVPYCTHHTFRHYFATRAILSGVDIPTVAKILGHSDNGALLLRIYCHLLDDHMLAMAKKIKVMAHDQAGAQLEAAEISRPPGNVIPISPDVFKNNPAATAAQSDAAITSANAGVDSATVERQAA